MLQRTFLTLMLVLSLTASPLCSTADREVRYLTFSIKSQHDFFVRDLTIEEVELKLDGDPIEIRYLGFKDVDTVTAVILENSPRTAPHSVSVPQWGKVNALDTIRYQMLYNFFGPLTRLGPVLLAQFYREFEVLQEFTQHSDELTGKINGMQPNFAGVALHQIEVGRALGRGVDYLRDRPEKRKILLLVTTTIDRQSYGNLDEYKLMLRNADVELFVISIAPKMPSASSARFEEKMNGYFFKNLVKETSGYAYIAGEYTYFEDLFTDLKGRITSNYTIGFYVTPGEELEEHSVKLKIDRKKCKIAHRKTLLY